MTRHLLWLAAVLLVSCGKDNPGTPTTATTTTIPQEIQYTISGTVSSAASGPLAGATVRVDDGARAGMSAVTDGAGRYSLGNLRYEGFSITASAPGHLSVSRGAMLTAGVPTATANFTLQPAAPFSRSGTGATVFTIPAYVTRVRVQANYGGSCENFIIHVAGRSLVNEILGTCSIGSGRTFDGTYTTNGGVTEVLSSTGINWSITEVR